MSMKTDELAVTGSQVRLPQWVVVFLVGLLANAFGGVWWASSTNSDLRHEIEDRKEGQARLESKVELQSLQLQTLREKLAEAGWNPSIQIKRSEK